MEVSNSVSTSVPSPSPFPMPEKVNPDKLTLVFEPEAVAVHCQNMSGIHWATFSTIPSPSTFNYLLVDIRGGTIDIAAYQINPHPKPHMEVLHEPTRHASGGKRVNLEFKRFLESLTGDEGFSRYLDTGSKDNNFIHQVHLDEIVFEEFEHQKMLFGNKLLHKEGKIVVDLGKTFTKEYGDQIEIQAQNEKHIEYRSRSLQIAYDKVETFFKPAVDGIIESVKCALEHVTDVDTIYLMGVFGGCLYVYDKLRSHFKHKYRFVTSGDEHAVVKGAALIGKKRKFLRAHCVDATFGVEVSIPFVEKLHEHNYKVEEQTNMCSHLFATFVEKGDFVESSDVYRMTVIPERQNQKQMRVQIYCSPEKDVWYTTGRRPSHAQHSTGWANVQKIGELIIPFHNIESGGDLEDQAVDITFDFSTAEIKVSGYHQKSQTKVGLVLDLDFHPLTFMK